MSLCLPLAAWVIVRHFNGRLSAKGLAARLGAIAVAQFLISPEVLVTMLLVGALSAVGAVFVMPGARAGIGRTLTPSLAGLAAAGLLLSPLILTMLRHAPANLNGSVGYPVDVLNLIVPTRVTAVGGSWGSSVSGSYPGNLSEQSAYLGLPLLAILASFAIAARSRPRTRLLLFVLLSSIVLSFGPRLTVAGHPTIWLPGALLTDLPLIGDAQPARFALYAFLATAVVIASWLTAEPQHRWLRGPSPGWPSYPSPPPSGPRCGGSRPLPRSPAAIWPGSYPPAATCSPCRSGT